MGKLICISIFLLIFNAFPMLAQKGLKVGLLPSINTGIQLPKSWKLNFKLESRQFILNYPDPESTLDYHYERTDLLGMASTKINLQSRLGAGYMLRQKGPNFLHRSLQQFTYQHIKLNIPMAHRIRADQTFSSVESNVFRLRYRFSLQIPLSGQMLDKGEFYLKLNTEVLAIYLPPFPSLELRGLGGIGNQIKGSHKLEMGLDYRSGRVIEPISPQLFLAYFSWYFTVNPAAD